MINDDRWSWSSKIKCWSTLTKLCIDPILFQRWFYRRFLNQYWKNVIDTRLSIINIDQYWSGKMFSGDTMIIDYKRWFENILSMLTTYWSNAVFAINVEKSFDQRWSNIRMKNTPITAAVSLYHFILHPGHMVVNIQLRRYS